MVNLRFVGGTPFEPYTPLRKTPKWSVAAISRCEQVGMADILILILTPMRPGNRNRKNYIVPFLWPIHRDLKPLVSVITVTGSHIEEDNL